MAPCGQLPSLSSRLALAKDLLKGWQFTFYYLSVVHDMEELLLADGDLVGGDLFVYQPQLHHKDDKDGTVDRIPEMKSIIDRESCQ